MKNSVCRAFGHFADDALHIGQETHVEHVVDLVEDEDVDVLERAVALLQMVEQSAGRGGEDVHAALQVFQLFSITDAAIDNRHAEVGELGEFLEGFLHLQRELARRLKNQHAQRAVAAETLDDRKGEGRGLARAGLRGADDVAARKDERDGLGLDGRRREVTHLLHAEASASDRPSWENAVSIFGMSTGTTGFTGPLRG